VPWQLTQPSPATFFVTVADPIWMLAKPIYSTL
jgi:hypothetical protein